MTWNFTVAVPDDVGDLLKQEAQKVKPHGGSRNGIVVEALRRYLGPIEEDQESQASSESQGAGWLDRMKQNKLQALREKQEAIQEEKGERVEYDVTNYDPEEPGDE